MISSTEIAPTADEKALYDSISHFANIIWEKTSGLQGATNDPKMLSNALFKRLWSHHRAYTELWLKDSYPIECDMILRAALEAAICLSANFRMREEFVLLMRRDAAHTLQGQIRSQRDVGEMDIVRDAEAALRPILASLPDGVGSAQLNWKSLATSGEVPLLYSWHRMLSGISSHVTGLSIIQAFGREELDEQQRLYAHMTRKMHLMMIAGATLQGTMFHTSMMEAKEEFEIGLALIDRMNDLSWNWPGVGNRK
jgi:hypothetical protein